MRRSSAPTCSSSSSATATPRKAPRPKASPRSTARTSRCGGGWCARRASRSNENRGQSPLAGPAIIADAVPPERRGKAYGITIGAIYAGLTLGPICAGFLVDLWGWRAVFLAGGALVLVLLLPIHFMLPASWRRPPKGAVHLPSTLLAVAAMLVLVGGAATLRQGAIGYGAMVLGLALLAAFRSE